MTRSARLVFVGVVPIFLICAAVLGSTAPPPRPVDGQQTFSRPVLPDALAPMLSKKPQVVKPARRLRTA